jgi:Winged helix DNA-binding domain
MLDLIEAVRLADWRMHNLRLWGPPLTSPVEVVRWLGAVQAQDFGPAKWALAQRTEAITDADVDRAFDEGCILRTHVLRPTWHFVSPEDIRWMLELTGPRVQQLSSYQIRRAELDEALLHKMEDLMVTALRDHNWLTRKELESVFQAAGIATHGQRLVYILMSAELNGVICSGPRSGKQHTYALLDERAPHAKRLNRDEALAELTRRYFSSHGPATAKDFRWWSGLTTSEIKRGLDMLGAELDREVIDKLTYWFAEPAPAGRAPSPTVHLLQGYDEYTVGYSETKYVLDASGEARSGAARATWPVTAEAYVYNQVVLLDTQVAGLWKRTLHKDGVLVEASLHKPLEGAQLAALEMAANRYGHFLGHRARVDHAPTS